MGSGSRIKYAISDLGAENFEKEILHVCKSASEASKKEAELVTQNVVDDPKSYNLVLGGTDGYDASIKKAKKLWETVDLNAYADFYKSLDRKSQGELICLESTFRANNLNLPKKDKKSRSENERMLIWDMHFKRALVQLKLNKLSREIITQQYKATIDIEPFLDEILSE
jgi:23S rRNA pseudoU1915 N3-methylase RlmH